MHSAGDFFHGGELESFQMKDHNVWELGQLCLDLSLALLLALFTAILVAPLEGVFFEEPSEALIKGRLEGDRQGHEWVESYRFFIAPPAYHYGLLHAAEQLIYDRGMSLLKLVPCLFFRCAAGTSSDCILPQTLGSDRCLLILQSRHYVGKEFVAVMLEHRRKFIINLLFDMLRRYYYGRGTTSATAPPSLILLVLYVLLVILLQEHQLIKLCEGATEPEVIADSWNIFRPCDFFLVNCIEEVLFKLVDCD